MKARIQVCSVVAGLLLLSACGAEAQAARGATQAPANAPAAPPVFTMPALHQNAPIGHIKRFPGDGDGAYKTHRYRDLFAEQGHTPAESRDKIEKAFHQLFHGDGQEERIYFETNANENGPLAYITDWANNEVPTEGMSYGMMIAVELNKRREFDAIWNWAHTYMLITDPNNPSVGYIAWSLNTDGTPRATGAAPDGEEYFTMALYFAAHRWGNGKGIYSYQAEADKILRGIRHHAVLTGTYPFRIHPTDPPFIPPNHLCRARTLTGWSKKPRRAENRCRVFGSGADRRKKRWADGGREPLHDEVRAQPARWGDGCVVSSAGVLRAMGAMGSDGRPRVLGDGGGCKPRLLQPRSWAGDRIDAGPQQL